MTDGRILAIGDVHGCDAALKLLLERVAPSPDDTVVILGDVVDKGPDSRGATARLLALRERCRLIYIRGNHEHALLQALDRRARGVERWQGFEQHETFESYGGPDAIPPEHVAFWESSINYWETETEIFVHAAIESDLPLDEQFREGVRFQYLTARHAPHYSGKRVVCGHTIQNSGDPLVLDGWVCLDTAAFRSRWLTCLDVKKHEIYQASADGRFQVLPLPAPPGARPPAERRGPVPIVAPVPDVARDVLLFAALFTLGLTVALVALAFFR
ncbi:MAG TPA: metallophosphoesterase family protein [Pirellulales bacterium]